MDERWDEEAARAEVEAHDRYIRQECAGAVVKFFCGMDERPEVHLWAVGSLAIFAAQPADKDAEWEIRSALHDAERALMTDEGMTP